MRRGFLMCALVLAGCSDSVTFLGPLSREGCEALRGTLHSGAEAGGTWRKNNSPHVLRDSVIVRGSLTIEPGTLVCAEPGAALRADSLKAAGLGDSPILFTSIGVEPWEGISAAESSTIRHASIENTRIALSGEGLLVESTTIRKTILYAVVSSGTFRDVTIDSACTAGGGCSAVIASGYRHTLFENVVIRNSGGAGIRSSRRCSITIDGGSIEGSAGFGLIVNYDPGGSCGLTVLRPVTITKGNYFPAIVTGNGAAALLGSGSQLTGNALDTLRIRGYGGLGTGDYRVTRDLPWRVESLCYSLLVPRHQLGSIMVEAGASLTFQGAPCIFDLDLVTEGTPAEPAIVRTDDVRFHMRGLSSDTVRIRNTELYGVRLRAQSAPVILDHVTLNDGSLELMAAGSRVHELTATGSAPAATGVDPDPALPPTLTLGAGTSASRLRIDAARRDAISIDGSGVTVSECTITSSARHAILVTIGPARIADCNLEGNAGSGVSNTGAAPVDATENWWGDAAGPFSPGGDGLSGNVLFVPYRTTRVVW